MKAILIHEDGGPEVLRYEDVPDPEPGPGEVLVRMRFASLNHLDVWTRKGLPSVPKPRILGADGSGVVEALGEGVEGFAPGDAVVINPGIEHGDAIHVIGEHTQGVHAELAAIPATNVAPLRDGVSFEEAAAFPLVYETAYRMLVTRARLQAGEWVLVWGIGGGVATAAFRIAQALGARTIVTSSSDEKLARAAELGADVDRQPRVGRRRRGGEGGDRQGRDVVVETVGEATWKRSLDAARPAAASSSAARPRARTRRPRSTGSGGSSSTCSARRWARGRTSRARTTSSPPGATPVIDTVFPLAEAAGRARAARGAASSSGRSCLPFRIARKG